MRLRSRLRRIVVMPVAIALLLVSVKLVSMSWFSTRGADAYEDERYRQSASEFDRLQLLNVIEPWRAHFGLGAVRHRQGDLQGAEMEFRRALDLAPDRCDVRFNLAVTIEAQGDRLTGGARREVEETEREDGLARYRVALDVANAKPCPAINPVGERMAETRERLRMKLGGEMSSEGEDVEPPPEQQDEPQDGQQADSRQQQLADRNQTGAGKREDFSDLDPANVRPHDESNW
jgi:hypothetical protein